jgi:phage-related minor tail protein
LAIQLHRKRLSGLKQDTAKFRYFEGMPDPTSPSAAEDVKAEIAAIKVQITGLDETNKRLSSGLEKLSKDIDDLKIEFSKQITEMKVSFESVKTRLSAALGVAGVLIALVVPVLLKTFTTPAATPAPAVTPVSAPRATPVEMHDLQRQTDKQERQVEKLTDRELWQTLTKLINGVATLINFSPQALEIGDLAKDKMSNYAQVADAAFFEANHKNNELSPFIDVDIHEFIVMHNRGRRSAIWTAPQSASSRSRQ